MMNEGPQPPPPKDVALKIDTLSKHGKRVLSIIEKSHGVPLHDPKVTPPRLDFGDFEQPDERCSIVLSPKKQILFEKETALKLLAQIAPGEIISEKGKGSYFESSSNSFVGLKFDLELSKDSNLVTFHFIARGKNDLIEQELIFEGK